MKKFLWLAIGVVLGIVAGTFLSGMIFGSYYKDWYFASVILSPATLTLGVPILFAHGPLWVSILAACGFVGTVLSFVMVWLRRDVTRWAIIAGIFSMLWSLGSVFSFDAMMSV